MPASDTRFTPEEHEILRRHFTNVDGPVFALVNLAEVVKGALFARYSRSRKSLRRLFLDEFYDQKKPSVSAAELDEASVGVGRAEDLYERVFIEYGDDSVAQLAGIHVAVEGASNILTKVLEWGRLMAYLEQSTRYVPFDDRPGGRWRYHVPAELSGSPLKDRFMAVMDRSFETYAKWFGPLQEYLRARYPKGPEVSDAAYRVSIRAKACDILRGLLPAATTANVGLYGSAQAYEALLLRLRHHPLAEARMTGERILTELRKVVPVFMRRVDHPERGEVWSRYLRQTAEAIAAVSRDVQMRYGEGRRDTVALEDRPSVRLTDFDPEGEIKVVAAALYPFTDLPDDRLLHLARTMPQAERDAVLQAYVGARTNRRHKPGRAFERTAYRFDIVADYAAFRDLQRHRMLTIEWQPLSPYLGYDMPPEIKACGAEDDWRQVMQDSRQMYEELVNAGLATVAPYAVAMAYRIRFYMQMNAREALHVIELRTSEQGHPNYRWLCREMLRLIRDQAGHRGIAASMCFVGETDPELERLEAERRNEARRGSLSSTAL